MITVVGLFLLGLALVGFVSEALDDAPSADSRNGAKPRHGQSSAVDAVIFMLCLLGIVAARAHKRKSDEDEE